MNDNSPRALLSEPISFDKADGPTHAPMVNGLVGGVATRIILDTGASDHLLSTDLCAATGLATTPGEPGTDSTGSSVTSWEARDVAVHVGELDLTLATVAVIDAPPPFRSGGIGAILSPQHLHPNAHAVLDLDAGRLHLLDAGGDLDAWLATTFPALRPITLAPVDSDGTVLVRAAIDPFPQVVTMLDTGAKATYCSQAAVPGLGAGGIRRSTGHGVGGSESFGVDVAGQHLQVGDTRLPVDLLIADHDTGQAGCVVGMDLLRGTVLVVGGPPGSPIRWLLPWAP